MKKLAAKIVAGQISGAVVEIHVPSALSDEALISEVAQQIITPLNASVPVTLVLRGVGADRKGADRFEALCSKLNDAGVAPNPALGLSLEPPAMPLHVYTLLARRYFGYILCKAFKLLRTILSISCSPRAVEINQLSYCDGGQ